jgi:two-component system nitrogen regulation sensor histidine kinase GlnL
MDTGKAAIAFVHSVRNPLNAIKGAVVYLRRKYSQENTLVEFTDLIETEITRLDEFVSRFLSASSTEAAATETDINLILRKIELLVSFQARLRKINMTYSYGDMPAVVVNSFQIEQAILNVVNNSIEALGPGNNITVRTGTRSCFDSDYVFVEISDTGPGISQPGTREIANRLKKAKGFGLMITREIIVQNGGHLEISSSKDSGTRITILLPAECARIAQNLGIS